MQDNHIFLPFQCDSWPLPQEKANWKIVLFSIFLYLTWHLLLLLLLHRPVPGRWPAAAQVRSSSPVVRVVGQVQEAEADGGKEEGGVAIEHPDAPGREESKIFL